MGRAVCKVVAALTASFAAGVASVFLLRAATALLGDPPPGGGRCHSEIDAGSGPAGTGREEVRWGVLPMNHCVGLYEGMSGGAHVVDSPLHPFGLLDLVTFPLAAVVAGLAVLTAAACLPRRPAERNR